MQDRIWKVNINGKNKKEYFYFTTIDWFAMSNKKIKSKKDLKNECKMEAIRMTLNDPSFFHDFVAKFYPCIYNNTYYGTSNFYICDMKAFKNKKEHWHKAWNRYYAFLKNNIKNTECNYINSNRKNNVIIECKCESHIYINGGKEQAFRKLLQYYCGYTGEKAGSMELPYHLTCEE